MVCKGCIAVIAVALITIHDATLGQEYPNKPIRIVASEAGGNADFNARLIAPGLSAGLGQAVVVENRATIIAAETVAKATPDGYTLLANGSVLWTTPLMKSVSYDAVRDYMPVTSTSIAPNILAVHPSLPVKSVKELIALAQTKPGQLNYAAGTPGSANHLAGELFKSMAKVNIVAIPYKAVAVGLTDVIGGQVQMMFSSAASVAPHVKSGRLVALAITSENPSPLFPGIPTVSGSGLPGYESASRQGMWVPAKTPVTIIARLNREIVRILNEPQVKERYLSVGAEAAPTSPEQFGLKIKSEIARIGKVIREGGIRAD